MTRAAGRFALWLGVGLLPAFGLGFGPAMAGTGAACAAAASGVPHAALVVDTGSSVATYCVALGASSISGIELVQKAGQQFGMTYRLGFGGQAVCMLNGVGGPSGDDCLTGQASYWGYWTGDGSGGWTWSSIGAASATVHDGGVQGWAWGVGIDGSTHPKPPATSIQDVCSVAPSPSPHPSHGGGGSGNGGNGGGGSDVPSSPSPSPNTGTFAGSSAPTPTTRPTSHHRSPSPRVHPGGSQTSSPPMRPAQVAAAGRSAASTPAGSLVGVLLALGLTATLSISGWLRVRSGRSKVTR